MAGPNGNPLARCPHCDAKLDAWTPVTQNTHPKEGDYTICRYCSQPLVFRADLTVREPSNKELVEFQRIVNKQIEKARRGELT